MACVTEDAAQVAKETIDGSKQQSSKPIHAVTKKHNKAKVSPNPAQQSEQNFSGTCMICGNVNHKSNECRYKDSTCNYCRKKGNLERVCLSKKRQKQTSHKAATVNSIKSDDSSASTKNCQQARITSVTSNAKIRMQAQGIHGGD